MAIKTAIIHDKSGFAPLTILGGICDVVKERFTLIIPLFLFQEVTKQSINQKSLFLQFLMTQHVTVQYDSNDMVIKLLSNIEEQTWNSLHIDFIVFYNFTFMSITLVL